MSEKKKVVLFIGSADREGVTEKLRATGTLYKRKMLESKPENWRKIIDIFLEYDVASVVVKLTNTSFDLLCREEYREVGAELLCLISSKSNLILAHESLLTGKKDKEYGDYIAKLNEYDSELDEDYQYLIEQYDHVFEPPKREVVEEVLDLFESYKMTLIPYNKNIELSLIASSFIDRNESELIFRIYVPSERIWASEAEKLLRLFRDYLYKVSGLNVRQDQYTTSRGVVYEFLAVMGLIVIYYPKNLTSFQVLWNLAFRIRTSLKLFCCLRT